MSNETARLARQLAEGANPDNLTDTAKAARERILATTNPLTMADVDWDYDAHYLAGAIFIADGEEVVMVRPHGDRIITNKGNLLPEMLTPNGKRYELREVGATVSSNENVGAEQPEHPATLETQADYENAPAGTVVAEPGGWACTKGSCGDWCKVKTWLTDCEMIDTERQVLRWGWGK